MTSDSSYEHGMPKARNARHGRAIRGHANRENEETNGNHHTSD
jgi:hypothetical protein